MEQTISFLHINPKIRTKTTSFNVIVTTGNIQINKYLFRWNKYRRSLVNWSWNLYSLFLKREEKVFHQKPSFLVTRTQIFITFTAVSSPEQLSLISEKGLRNESRKIQGKRPERKLSNPFSTLSRLLFVHAFSVFPNDSRN